MPEKPDPEAEKASPVKEKKNLVVLLEKISPEKLPSTPKPSDSVKTIVPIPNIDKPTLCHKVASPKFGFQSWKPPRRVPRTPGKSSREIASPATPTTHRSMVSGLNKHAKTSPIVRFIQKPQS